MRELPAGCVIWVMGTFRLFLIRATCTPGSYRAETSGIDGLGYLYHFYNVWRQGDRCSIHGKVRIFALLPKFRIN